MHQKPSNPIRRTEPAHASQHKGGPFERLAAKMSAVVFELAPDGETLYVNPAIEAVAGYRPEELIGRNWWTLLTPAECGDGAGRLRERLVNGDVSRCEFSLRGKSGEMAALEVTSANAYGPSGALERVACFGIDVTDRGRSREQNYFQASLLEQVRNAVVATDMAGRVLYWNKHAESLYAWPAAEALGRNRFELVAPEESRPAAEAVLDCLWRDGHWEGEFLAQRKGGGRVTVYSAETVRRDLRGNLSGFLSVSFDLTERLALEEQLRHSQKMEAVGRLAGGVAHDFNNLLTVILGFSESLLESPRLDAALAVKVRQIQKAGERGANLTKQLLTFSRRQPLALSPLCLNDVVRDMEAMLEALVGPHIELSLLLGDRLSPIEADSGQLSQVLLNLAANARDAMPSGGRLTIETRLVAANEAQPDAVAMMPASSAPAPDWCVMLAVHDTGCGMSDEVKSRAFEPFFTTKPRGSGVGMGLATVYGLANQCRSRIAVSSEPGRGSVFRIYFPTAHSSQSQPTI